MGNDGGSIPDRRDLVRAKPKVCRLFELHLSHLLMTTQAEQADKANQTRARWFFCALSKVSMHSQQLHNKHRLILFLEAVAGTGCRLCPREAV